MATDFTQTAGSLLSGVMSAGFAIGAVVLVMSVLVGTMLYVRHVRRYNLIVEIRAERSTSPDINDGIIRTDDQMSEIGRKIRQGNYKIIYDKGAILFDKKDKTWYFRIKGERIELPVPPFNVLTPSTKGNVLKLWQKSNEEYFYLLPDSINPTIVRADGKEYKVAQLSTKVVEGDIAYWNIKRKEKVKKLFDPESLLAKIVAYLPQIVGGFLLILLIWIVFDKIPGLINQLTDLANALREANQGTVIR